MKEFLKNEFYIIDSEKIITLKYLQEMDKRKNKLKEKERKIVEKQIIEYILEKKEFYGEVLIELANRESDI